MLGGDDIEPDMQQARAQLGAELILEGIYELRALRKMVQQFLSAK